MNIVTKPGYVKPKLFREDLPRADVMADLGPRDRAFREGSLVQSTINEKEGPFEYGVVTGRTLLNLRHIHIYISIMCF